MARALGADGIIYSGDNDEKMLEGIEDVVDRWGGKFFVTYESKGDKALAMHHRKGFSIVHLTMYGIPLQKKIKEIRKKKNVLIVVGGEKVWGNVYDQADYNIAVTNQPHSEIAALTLFLHEYFKGKELEKKFKGKIKIVPQDHGKKVVNNEKE